MSNATGSRRKGLTPAKILAEAQALAEAGGLEALTMRALASQLGVAAMAIYNHFADREALLDAMAEDVFAQLLRAAEKPGLPKPGIAEWRHRIQVVMMRAWRICARHRPMFRLALTRPNKPSAGQRLAEQMLSTLQQAGLSPQQSLNVYHTFGMVMMGFAFWQSGPGMERQFAGVVDWLLDSIEMQCDQLDHRSRRPT